MSNCDNRLEQCFSTRGRRKAKEVLEIQSGLLWAKVLPTFLSGHLSSSLTPSARPMHHIYPSHGTKPHFVLLAKTSKRGGENFAQSRPSHFISAFFPSFDITATPTFVSRLHIFAVSIFKRNWIPWKLAWLDATMEQQIALRAQNYIYRTTFQGVSRKLRNFMGYRLGCFYENQQESFFRNFSPFIMIIDNVMQSSISNYRIVVE
ncbi:hypothetical protein T07_3867 [Trichinella nelsoni]|uniref:Uncharacterized protein n=1 Tax=Trichinella nelsoni TaxID=6336 RepID=A0A0V0SCH1_9BILA|nr:hypothetical protein T07_3867 [Trichinella nelsoni]